MNPDLQLCVMQSDAAVKTDTAEIHVNEPQNFQNILYNFTNIYKNKIKIEKWIDK